MSEPTAPPPEPPRAVTGEHPAHACNPGPFVATKAWTNGLANRRTIAAMLGAASLFAASVLVTYRLVGDAEAKAKADTASVKQDVKDGFQALNDRLDKRDERDEKRDEKNEKRWERYFGPMAPREPRP